MTQQSVYKSQKSKGRYIQSVYRFFCVNARGGHAGTKLLKQLGQNENKRHHQRNRAGTKLQSHWDKVQQIRTDHRPMGKTPSGQRIYRGDKARKTEASNLASVTFISFIYLHLLRGRGSRLLKNLLQSLYLQDIDLLES